MSTEYIVQYIDNVSDIIAFSAMLFVASWTLVKYRHQSKDFFFVFSLCMYPLSYSLLAYGAIHFLTR
jgi:hypothetical protein